jgi:hypothetical protein
MQVEQFFESLDEKSRLFRTCVWVMTVTFYRLQQFLNEFSRGTTVTNAYIIYREHYIERELEKHGVMM